MKYFLIKISSFFIILFSTGMAQENKDSLNTSFISPLERIEIKFEEFDFYRDLNRIDLKLNATNDSNTLKLWTSMAIQYEATERSLLYNPENITSPLYQKYLEDSKFNPFTYALGMAQAAAVGYLAYMHIKKYGLFR